jgi:hypothetical protein
MDKKNPTELRWDFEILDLIILNYQLKLNVFPLTVTENCASQVPSP